MEILYFQIAIFFVIFIIGSFGNRARLNISLIIGLFTLLAVFTSFLMVLQFFTIFFSYNFSEKFADPDDKEGGYDLT